MGLIFQNDFSLGWRPSDAELNGPPNALLRMQNVKLDETGALTLIPGSSKLPTGEFPAFPHSIFSKVINGTLYYIIVTADRQVYAFLIDGTGYILTALASATNAAFGAAYNFIIICSGTSYVSKYLPTVSLTAARDLTCPSPNAPGLSRNNPYTKDMTGTIGSYTALTGGTSTVSTSGSYVKMVSDATLLACSATFSYGGATDSTNLSSGSVGQDSDTFTIEVKIDNPLQVSTITVIFKDNTDATSYFQFVFRNEVIVKLDQNGKRGFTNSLNIPPGVAAKLDCSRGDFEVIGRPLWSNIGSVVVQVAIKNTLTDFYFDNLIFSGGNKGSLNGDIEYIQVLTDSTTPYTSRSVASAIATVLSVVNASVNVTPYVHIDAWSDGFEIYRRISGIFYRVKASTSFVAFDDQMTDEDAILADIQYDTTQRGVTALTSDILEVVGPFFNRWLYFTSTHIYISLDGNPELYKLGTGILSPYGSTSEEFLWAHKFGNSAILVGTTNDIYEITGTLTELPDGTIDATIRPTGCQNPPINRAAAATANELYYVANDSIRQVNPSGYSIVGKDELDLLFKGKDRFNMIAPRIRGGNQDLNVMAVSKNELYWSFIDTNGYRKMFAFDLLRQYWYEFKSVTGGYGGPVCMFTQEDGTLLAGYAETGNSFVRILNSGILIDGTTNPEVYILTKFYNGNLPRNRKDSIALKLKINTGGSGIEILMQTDDDILSNISLGFVNTIDLDEVVIDLSSLIGVVKSYSLLISGNCPYFKLTDWSIDFIERPTGITYLRTEPTNYGSQGRKKIYQIPFTVDTVGNEISCTPYLDGVAQAIQLFNTGVNGKQTLEYLFSSVGVARDVFFKLLATGAGGMFEYYGTTEPRVIEVLPDNIYTYTIPDTNFGTFARKRFIAFAFVIDSNGMDFTFTPTIDGVAQTEKTFNTFGKQTAIYYFDTEAVGIDIGGTINCGTGMEFYGVNNEDSISEKLPPSVTFLKIPTNNFGVANKKRLRTIPLVIDTKNHDVTYVPKVDGNAYSATVFNTSEKRTVLYYFETDAFGIDLSGTLSGSSNFEFYGVLTPETVEVLPVAKKFDQLGPLEFKRSGNVRGFRVRMISNTVGINYSVYIDDVLRHSDSFSTLINIDKTYEIPWLRKFLNGSTCRIELSATAAFHRISSELKYSESGAATQGRWMKIG